MNTDKMIPISYVKKITPLVVGDVIYVDSRNEEVTITSELLTWYNEDLTRDHKFFVASFADRPNAGARPVVRGVDVDATSEAGDSIAVVTSWALGLKNGRSVKSWRPNHQAMLEQYQAERLEEAYNQNDLPSGIDAAFDESLAWPTKEESERMKPIGQNGNNGEHYTKDATVDRLGVFLRHNNLILDKEGVVDCVIRQLAEMHDIDTRSDEDKLRDEVIWCSESLARGFVVAGELADKLLASDKFDITLRGK